MANVLVVDDSRFMRAMLARILTGQGHQVTGEAENGQEAIELYGRLHPDLVTMDIVMPEVDGTDALSAVQTILAQDPEAAIVMVSTMGQPEVMREFSEAGAKSFIVKPFQDQTVGDTVTAVLKTPQAEQAWK